MIDPRIFESMLRGPEAQDATRDALISLNRLARRIVEREILPDGGEAIRGPGDAECEAGRQLEAFRKAESRSRYLD